ncbi:MAG: hypothetical protein ACI9PU_002306, partial [Ascidiaceihabitans sp.]
FLPVRWSTKPRTKRFIVGSDFSDPTPYAAIALRFNLPISASPFYQSHRYKGLEHRQ